MKKNSAAKNICITAACMALCCVLPIAFHAVGLGSVLSPMHIPVLLCGMLCGGGYGLLCGLVGPVLSSVLTGMPSATALIWMVPELIVYGVSAGLFMRLIRTKSVVADLYISLLSAMLLGRVIGGIAQYFFWMGKGSAYSLAAWGSSYFVTALPAIVCHLILIPVLVLTLTKAKLIPDRYTVAVREK